MWRLKLHTASRVFLFLAQLGQTAALGQIRHDVVVHTTFTLFLFPGSLTSGVARRWRTSGGTTTTLCRGWRSPCSCSAARGASGARRTRARWRTRWTIWPSRTLRQAVKHLIHNILTVKRTEVAFNHTESPPSSPPLPLLSPCSCFRPETSPLP